MRSLIFSLALLCLFVPQAHAQDTASQDVTLTLDIGTLVDMRRLSNNMNFQDQNDGTYLASDGFCIASAVGSFALTVSGPGGGAFELATAEGLTVPYSAQLVDLVNSSSFPLTAGQPQGGLTAPASCANGAPDTSQLEFSVTIADLPGGGQYTGSATVLISTE